MSFPIIQFKSTRVEVDDDLKDLTEQKLSILDKFIGSDSSTKCEVEFEKVTAQQNGQIHRVEANILHGGRLFRAEATELSFEEAIDKVRQELEEEIRRAGEKQESLFRRGARRLKEMMRRG